MRTKEQLERRKAYMKAYDKIRCQTPEYKAYDKARNPTPARKASAKVRRQMPKYKASAKARDLKRKFGMTMEQYNILFESQNGCCKICGKCQLELSKSLAVDHDHITMEVRGLLCQKCNLGLGQFDDNKELLQ